MKKDNAKPKKNLNKTIKKNKTTNNEKVKKKRGKAFTLIELLAVIIILGVLLIIAIPSVTSYISDSRKSSYVATAKNIISGARNVVNEGKISVYDTDSTYYIPYNIVKTENDTKTPYGDMQDAYVVLTYDGIGYDYYFTSLDTANIGMYLTYYDDINNEKISTDMKAISTDIAICGKENIVIFDKNGLVVEKKDSTDCIEKGHSYDSNSVVEYIASNSSFFDFDSSTGTITDIHDIVDVEIVDMNTCANYFHSIVGWYSSGEEALQYCQSDLINDLKNDTRFANSLASDNILKVNKIEKYPKNIVIPSEINGIKVTNIGSSAFHMKSLESVTLPNTITKIDNAAFSGNNLKSIVLPNNLTSIGDNAFEGNNLSKVTIPRNVSYIGYNAFSDNSFLYEVVNKTDNSFDWNSIFGYNSENGLFETGTYKYEVDENTFFRNNYRYYEPYMIQKQINKKDTLNIDIDSMFDYGPHKFNLKNSNGYKIYSYNVSTRMYEENTTGPMNYIDGYCCKRLSNFYIKDSSNNIVFAGLFKFSIDNCAC